MNTDKLTSNPLMFLQEPLFWRDASVFILLIAVLMVAVKHFDLVDAKVFYKVMLPLVASITFLTLLMLAIIGSSLSTKTAIREELTEHYNLNKDALSSEVDFVGTEEVQQVANNSAINDGDVILSKYDSRAGTVTLYFFTLGEADELKSRDG